MTKQIAILSILIITLLSLSTEQVRAGGGPANDVFANAFPLVIESGSASLSTTNVDATKEPGEPDHAENIGGRSVWFKITPTATTVFRINTMDTTFDTLLAVYTGDSVNTLVRVAFNDDCYSSCGDASTVDLMVTAGTTYYIAVDGFNNGGAVGSGAFRISVLDNIAPYQDDLAGAYNLGNSHGGSISGTNFNGTRQPGEPDHVNPAYPGAKTVWYRWQAVGTTGVAFELTENFDSQITIYKAPTTTPTFAQLTRVAWNIDSVGDAIGRYRAQFLTEPGANYFIAVAGHSQNPQAADSGNFQLKFQPAWMRYSTDLDPFRNKATIALFRPSEGTWYVRPDWYGSNYGAFRWGLDGDIALAADFTGEGDSEYAVVRNQNGQKVWYIRTTPAPTVVQWGLASDKAVVGDFDGDSRADMTAIRNSAQGFVWYVRQSLTGSMRTFVFGTTGDRPILGDFDGDGKTDVAVIRNTAAGLIWYILYSAGGSSHLPYTKWSGGQFGHAPDVPAVEDFDGDGKTDIAVFRPSTGTWYILQSTDGHVRIDNFGLSGDKPQPADYNGDGKADLCVYRPSQGTWYIARPTGVPGQNFDAVNWGIATDIPVSSLSSLSQ